MRISTYSLKGGVGKTTTALAVAGEALVRALAPAGEAVQPPLLVDADAQRKGGQLLGGSTAEYGYGGQRPTLNKVRRGRGHYEGGYVMFWDSSVELPNHDGLTVIDCPPDAERADRALACSDLVLMVVRPDPLSYDRLVEVLRSMPPLVPAWLVLNGMQRGKWYDEQRRLLTENLDYPLFELPFVTNMPRLAPRRRLPAMVEAAYMTDYQAALSQLVDAITEEAGK